VALLYARRWTSPTIKDQSSLVTTSELVTVTDLDSLIAELERLGLKLTATRLLDGTYRVNRWRMPDAIVHAQQIEDLWAKHIGDDKARMILLGAHLARRSSNRSSSAT
jgi:hypothetical protein